MKKYTLYILLDKMLNKGQRIAQAAHVGVEIARDLSLPLGHWDSMRDSNESVAPFEDWMHDPKVVCLVADAAEIADKTRQCRESGYWVSDFADGDFMTMTYAIGPVPRENEYEFAGWRLA